jgi:cytochrome c556
MSGLDKGLHPLYEELEDLSTSSVKLSSAFLDVQRKFMSMSGEATRLTQEYKKLKDTTFGIIENYQKQGTLSAKLVSDYAKQAKCIQDLKKQYEDMAKIEKILGIAAMTNMEKTKAVMEKLHGGTTMLVGKLATLGITYENLKGKLLEYNRTVFDGMRIGERYGDSLLDYESALAKVTSSTSLSKQNFAELNLMVKQMSVGIPMTSEEVGKLATSLSGRLGYSAEQVTKAFQALLEVQNKLPDIFERVNRAQTGGASSAKALYNQLVGIGATRQQIEAAMNAISQPKTGTKGLMEFEKNITKSRQEIENATLDIAGKMQPALETVAKIEAIFAASVAAIPGIILMATAGFATFGVPLARAGFQLKEMIADLLIMRGLAFSGGGSIAGGAVQAGGTIMAQGVGQAAGSAAMPTLRTAGQILGGAAAAETAGASGAAAGGGAAVGGAVAGMTALTLGAVAAGAALVAFAPTLVEMANKARDDKSAKRTGIDTERFQSGNRHRWDVTNIAKNAGITDTVKASEEGRGESVANIVQDMMKEKDETKVQVALSGMLAKNLLSEDTVRKIIVSRVKDQKKAEQEIKDVISKSVAESKSMAIVQRTIEVAMVGQRQQLQVVLDYYKHIGDAGKDAASSLKEGLIGTETAGSMMTAGVNAMKQQYDVLAKQTGTQVIEMLSDQPEIMEKVFGGGSKAIAEDAKAIDNLRKEMDKLQDQKVNITSDKGLTGEGADKNIQEKRKKIDEEISKKQAVIDKKEQALQQKVGAAAKNSGLNLGIELTNKELDATREKLKVIEDIEKAGQSLLQHQIDDKAKLLAAEDKITDSLAKQTKLQTSGMLAGMEKETAVTERNLAMHQQLLSLADAQANIASKLGLPQSYEAVQKQVTATKQVLEDNQKIYDQQQAIVTATEKEYGIRIDTKSVVEGTKTVEQAVAEGIASSKNKQGKSTKDVADAEAMVVQAIKKQVPAATEVTQATAKLLDITKTWREGWLDAMDEQITNAGEFSGVMSFGAQNVPGKMAAGAMGTFRYGSTNNQDIQRSQLQATPTSFTTGAMSLTAPMGPSDLQKSGVGMTEQQALDIAKSRAASGNVFVPQNSLAETGGADVASAAAINAPGTTGTTALKPKATGTSSSWLGRAVSYIKELGSDQPGGPSAAAASDIQKSSSTAGAAGTATVKHTFELTPDAAKLLQLQTNKMEYNGAAPR